MSEEKNHRFMLLPVPSPLRAMRDALSSIQAAQLLTGEERTRLQLPLCPRHLQDESTDT